MSFTPDHIRSGPEATMPAGSDGYPMWANDTLTFYIWQGGTARAQASRAWVSSLYAPLASPTFTGTAIIPAINGGSAANDDITIQGTSNATRTTSYVIIQPNGGWVVVGTTSAISPLDVRGSSNAGANTILNVQATDVNGDCQFSLRTQNGGAHYFGLRSATQYGFVTGSTGFAVQKWGGTTNLLFIDTSSAGGGTASFSGPVNLSRVLNLASFTNSSPSDGDLWFDGTDLKFRVGGVTKTVTLT